MYRNNYATYEENVNRMKSLMGITENTEVRTKSQPIGNIEKIYKGPDGNAYAIIKENANYYLKKSSKDRDLTLNDFEYLGGNRQCKSMFEYKSYNQAEKVLKEEFISIAEDLKKKNVIQEEVKRVDYNLNETPQSREMRTEMERAREILENIGIIKTKGSTSVIRKIHPLFEKVDIADDKNGVLTDSVKDEKKDEEVNESDVQSECGDRKSVV